MKKYTAVSVRQLDRKGKPWQARAKYKDLTGKWKEVSKMLPEAKGKREAQRMANEWLDELNKEADIMPNTNKRKTIEEVFVEYLNYQLATNQIERSTHTNQMNIFRIYIKPYVGDYIFTAIDKTVINIWLTKLYSLGLAQSTIHTAFFKLKKIYNYYYENGELLKNPFKGVKVPKKGKPKITHLTDEQMDDVLTAVYAEYNPEDPMYVGVLIPFYSGLRRSEICGLRWNDIDFYKKTITVRTSIGISNFEGYKGYAKDPKNNSSARTFPMVPQLEEALRARYEAIKPEPSWFVIGNMDEFMFPNSYNRKFRNFRKKHNLIDAYGESIKPHGLRHNLASVGIRSGMDIASLSLMMGHASRTMTLDTYGDANADALELASIKLKEKFDESTVLFNEENHS